MADITDILQSLTQNISGLEGVTQALKDFDAAKKEALARGDAKAVLQIENLIKTINDLNEAREEQKKLEEEYIKVQKEGGKVTDELRNKLDKNAKQIAKSERILTNAITETTEAQKKQTAAMIANNEAMMDAWKSSTLLGKTYAGLTSGIAKVVGGLTAGSMALQAWDRHVEGVELRQNILIRQFRGFKKTTDGLTGGLSEYVDTMGTVISESERMSNAIIKARGNAIRMGVEASQVNGVMLDFARIAGTRNPEELEKLTTAALTVARTMDLDLGTAVDFVRARIDKFGGTGASAVVALQHIREEAEIVNNMFGRTVVRADDVAKTLLDISRSTNVYAIDQRFVSGILRENIARLQSTGDSYDLARRKAEAYTRAVTGAAPDWMQVLAGQDLVGEMQKAFGEGGKAGIEAFEAKFKEDLDAAAPGLSDQVTGILTKMKKGDIQQYEGMRLIQELTSGSEVGIAAMNKQILKLANSKQGIEILADQFGVTRAEAYGMVEQAEAFEKRQKDIADIMKDPAKLNQLIKEQRVTKQTADLLRSTETADKVKKDALKEILSLKDQQIAREKEADRIMNKRKEAAKIVERSEIALKAYKGDFDNIVASLEQSRNDVARYQEELIEAQKSGDPEAIAQAERNLKINEEALKQLQISKDRQDILINQAKETISQNASIASGDETAQKTMEEMAAENLKAFEEYSDTSGKSFEAMKNDLSTIKLLLMGAVGFFVGGKLVKALAGHAARGGTFKTLSKDITKGFGDTWKQLRGKGGPQGPMMPKGAQKRHAKADKVLSKAEDARAAGKTKKAEKLEAKAAKHRSDALDFMKKSQEKTKTKITPPKQNMLTRGMNLFKDQMSDIGQKFGSFVSGAGEVAEEAPKAGAKVAEAAPKKSIFGRFMDKAKSATESVKGAVSGGILGKIGKVLGPLVKFLGKMTGWFSGIITAAMELPDIISDMLEGKWTDALARMIPALTGTLGAALGTLLGPLGTAAGGAAGSIAGEYLKDYILEKDTEAAPTRQELPKEAPKAEAPKAGNVNITKDMDLSSLPQTGTTAPAGTEQTQRTPASPADVATATAAMAGNQSGPTDLVASISPVNGDGSVTLTIPNFRDAVVGANNLGRGNRIRTPGLS